MSVRAATDNAELPFSPPPAPGSDDALDDALVGLPAPPRARARVLSALLIGISLTSSALAYQLRDDVRYAFSSSSPISLGDGRTADPSAAGANRLVTVRVAPQMAGAVRYTRPLVPGAAHVVFPVAARDGAPLYVQAEGAPSSGEVTGRLLTFDAAGGRYAGVGRYLRTHMEAPVSGQTWLLIAGDTPRSAWWAPPLSALLLAIALTDLLLLARLLRPLGLSPDPR